MDNDDKYETRRVSILDDQGGGVMIVQNDDVSPTLRAQMKHHEPTVFMLYGHRQKPNIAIKFDFM